MSNTAPTGRSWPASARACRACIGRRRAARPLPATDLWLADGRRLLSSKPLGFARPRALLHTALIAGAGHRRGRLPLVRHLTKRLNGCSAASNRSRRRPAARQGRGQDGGAAGAELPRRRTIEQLVGAHRRCWPASHELRTPLARIAWRWSWSGHGGRQAPRRPEQDIAELDQLLDEIPLASRSASTTAWCWRRWRRWPWPPRSAPTTTRCSWRARRRWRPCCAATPPVAPCCATCWRTQRHGRAPTQVRLDADAAQLSIRVWDAGPGVPEAEWEDLRTVLPMRRHARQRRRRSWLGVGAADRAAPRRRGALRRDRRRPQRLCGDAAAVGGLRVLHAGAELRLGPAAKSQGQTLRV